MKKIYQRVGIFVLLCAAYIQPASAKTPVWVSTDHIRAQLIPGVASIGKDTIIEAALDVELDKGWHTYWRVPGDSGLPPRFDWEGSDNVESVETSYPAPKRKSESGGLYTFGYSDRVTFPLVLKLKQPETATALKLKLEIMVCKDICIPQHLELSAAIPAGTGAPSSMAPLIKKAQEKLPVSGARPTLKIDTVVVSRDALVANIYAKDGFENTDLFATAPDFALTLPPEITLDKDDARRAMIRIPVTLDIENLATRLKGQELTLTLVNDKKAIEKKIQY